MSVAHVLLGLLDQGPQHGYGLKHAHDAALPAARPLAFGQVYATLARLERDGWAEVVVSDAGAGPERTTYAITDAGRAELERWLEIAEQPSSYAADELVRKTVVALVLHRDPTAQLRRQRGVILQRMRETAQALDAATDPAARAVLDHTLTHLDADLRWLDASAARTTTRGAAR